MVGRVVLGSMGGIALIDVGLLTPVEAAVPEP